MDPVRNMLAGIEGQQGAGAAQSPVTVEEGMDCRDANMRFFSMINRISNLNITLSISSVMLSCKFDKHEIIVDQKRLNQTHETWALGDRPYQKFNALMWNCHVRGAELLLSTSNGASTILYELTRFNELTSNVKLKSIHLQQQPIYFNLNDAKTKAPIDGHTLLVQCNGNLNKIQVQNTKLLCQCNKKSSILPQSLIGDVPFELVRHESSMSLYSNADNNVTNSSLPNSAGINEDDLIVCDAIFSVESNCPLDLIRIELRYKFRAVVLEIRSFANQTGTSDASNQQQKTNVSSSTPKTLRVRVRVTNFGVCIMPIMMTEYNCRYRFNW